MPARRTAQAHSAIRGIRAGGAPRRAPAWLAAALWLASASAPALAAERILAVDHLGGVRLGMTTAQAERALGSVLAPYEGKRSEACWIGSRRDGTDPGVGYMVEAGRVTRIDVFAPQKGARPSVATAAGIGIGSTAAAVKQAYPKVAAKPHPIGDPGSWLTVEQSPHGSIRLQLEGGKVTSLWAARPPALDYYEGCL